MRRSSMRCFGTRLVAAGAAFLAGLCVCASLSGDVLSDDLVVATRESATGTVEAPAAVAARLSVEAHRGGEVVAAPGGLTPVSGHDGEHAFTLDMGERRILRARISGIAQDRGLVGQDLPPTVLSVTTPAGWDCVPLSADYDGRACRFTVERTSPGLPAEGGDQ